MEKQFKKVMILNWILLSNVEKEGVLEKNIIKIKTIPDKVFEMNSALRDSFCYT